jgi:hypothetical protein
MATITADRAASTFPVFKPSGAGNLGVAWGTYEFSSNPAAADVIEFCKVPAGATIVGGWIYADDVDAGAEELDWDFGYAANGVDEADPDAFGNMGTITGDVFAAGNLAAEAGWCYPIQATIGSVLRSGGPKTLSAETTIIATVNTDAATLGTTPRVTVVIFYAVA